MSPQVDIEDAVLIAHEEGSSGQHVRTVRIPPVSQHDVGASGSLRRQPPPLERNTIQGVEGKDFGGEGEVRRDSNEFAPLWMFADRLATAVVARGSVEQNDGARRANPEARSSE